MDGKITWGQVWAALMIAMIACGLGIWQGTRMNVEDQVKAQLDAQEKAHWDIEVKKMEAEKVKSFPINDAIKSEWKWIVVKMEVTAYCPCEICCDDWGKIPVSSGKRKTAGGHIIHVGDKFVAAPRTYPFGTEMVIEGYAGGSIVKVEDVGGAIKGNKLDLYFDTHQEALNWGVQDVFVKVKVKAV